MTLMNTLLEILVLETVLTLLDRFSVYVVVTKHMITLLTDVSLQIIAPVIHANINVSAVAPLTNATVSQGTDYHLMVLIATILMSVYQIMEVVVRYAPINRDLISVPVIQGTSLIVMVLLVAIYGVLIHWK